MMDETDVLIVGGGPTGTTLALELAVHGIPFRVIDKMERRSDKSRALVVQPRTLELLNRHDDVQKLVLQGNPSSGARFYINRKQVMDIDISGLAKDTAFPLILVISQCETEEFLDSCLAKHGFGVEYGVEAKSIFQDSNGVTVNLHKSDGTQETIRAKYVVGADGAHSVVRRAAKDLTFEGAAYPQDFILCDAHLRKSKISWNRFSLCFGQDFIAIFPMKDDTVRVVASRIGSTKDTDPTLEDFQSMMNQLIPDGGQLHDPSWLARFQLHHRGVSSYRDGRLFVAGDAAHIHSPAGAQGMNTGIQDAINLGWKLAKVLRRERQDSFLDTYDIERRPVGQKLLATSDRMFTLACSSNPFFILLRTLLFTWILPWVVSSTSRRAGMFRFISEFGISYRKSPLGGTASGFSGPVVGGDRAPDGKIGSSIGVGYFSELLTPDKYHLVFFSGVGENAAGHKVIEQARTRFDKMNLDGAEVHIVLSEEVYDMSGYIDMENCLHLTYGFSHPAYVYIRPDGYIAHTGLLSALGEFMDWLG
ncbi:FAD binding domain-containing protein [Xylariaceae sp. FL0662B]|nr:FAD binding domain-containing protein [Xylariaceae sp. FL0662B]